MVGILYINFKYHILQSVFHRTLLLEVANRCFSHAGTHTLRTFIVIG